MIYTERGYACMIGTLAQMHTTVSLRTARRRSAFQQGRSTAFANTGVAVSTEPDVSTGLDKVWDVKPLVNGKEIMDALQLKYGGPVVSKWQRKLLAW